MVEKQEDLKEHAAVKEKIDWAAAGFASKSAMKRAHKEALWEKKKLIIREKRKEKNHNKKSAGSKAHLRRFETPMGTEKRDKKEKQALFAQLCLKGQKVIIDCDFDKLMTEKELKSLG